MLILVWMMRRPLLPASNWGLDVAGISVVHGNSPLQDTLRNTLRLKDLLKSEVPVYPAVVERFGASA